MALAALLAFAGTNALALSLGRITVQSALGEPLNAEIDIPEITAEEAASLKVQLASPANFRSAGLDYSPVLTGLRMVLQKRPDGRSYLRLSSDRLVQEPFVDLILDAGWQSGRVVRNYTMLFDPPDMRPAPVARPLAVPFSAPLTAPLPAPVPAPTAEPRVVQAPRSAAPVSPPVARPPAIVAEARSAAPAPGNTARQVTVRSGDTASKIALRHKLFNVSLDQMLVALQRGNPNAFIEGNVNRIKAGAILTLPSDKQATDITPVQASQIITAQSQDFNRYRLGLASNIGDATQAPAERNISGTIQATVDDKKPAAQTPDKLTLSKGSVQSAAELEQMALARNAEDSAKRAAQISQNTNDLNQLAQTVASMAAANAASGAADGAPLVAAPASVPGVPKPAAPVLPAAAPPTTQAATSFLDELIDNPMLPATAAALLVLLAGLGIYKVRQRQKKKLVDSSFMDSGFQAESFFGDSGGQKVDTQESSATPSSMMYSASQLDADDEADPVAEAEVYLAYGRDLQAEELLREALLTQPERIAIHQKLLAIFAKRQDAKAYAAMATLVYPLLKTNDPQWSAICAAGLALEPGNPMYLAGGRPAPELPPSMPSPLPVIALAATEVAAAEAAKPVEDNALDLDFDLDFSLDEAKPVAAVVPAQAALPIITEAALPASSTASAASPTAQRAPLAAAEPTADLLEFDFDSLSLELDDSDLVPTRQPSLVSTEALESKLALAEEFKANGDNEGARALMQQVIDEADDTLKAKAQQALSQL